MTKKIAVIVGSSRKGSINRKVADALSKLGQGKAEFNFIAIDALPMFNEDLEKEGCQQAIDFRSEVNKNDAILIVSPEYNRSLPALLKNAIDWGSRPGADSIWRKPVAICGTSPGGVGTAAMQQHLRAIIGNIGAIVMPGEIYLQYKPDLVDDAGSITNEDTKKFLQGFVDKFIGFFDKHA